MKTIFTRFLLSAVFLVTLIMTAYSQNNYTRKIKYPYLHDTIISKPIAVTDIRGTTFDPDGGAVYFVDYNKKVLRPIMVSHYINSKWSLPDTIESTRKFKCSDPFLSPDGSKLFFANFTSAPPKIFVMERINENWNEPVILNDLIKFPATIEHQVFPTLTDNGSLYFAGGAGDIYCSRFVNGQYSEPEILPATINTSEYPEWDACIARDESFIIFCSKRSDSEGDSDLYISCKENGKWMQAINMGPDINSNLFEGLPGISPDGKYLFFVSNKSGSQVVYQVDLKPIVDSYKRNLPE